MLMPIEPESMVTGEGVLRNTTYATQRWRLAWAWARERAPSHYLVMGS